MWRNRKARDGLMAALSAYETLVVFDTETTGLSPKNNRIIEFGAVKYKIENGTITDVLDKLDLYIRPPEKIDKKIEEITHITNELLDTMPYESYEIAKQIADFLEGSVLAAHNKKFDMGFVSELFKRQKVEYNFNYVIDTLELARDLSPDTSHKLSDLASLYGIDDGVAFHNAAEDAGVTGKLLRFFIAEYRKEIELEEIPECLKDTPKINKISYWAGYKGHSRIYVTTSTGELFYDCWKKAWGEKTPGFIEKVNMDYIESSVMLETRTQSINDFAKFRGVIKCS